MIQMCSHSCTCVIIRRYYIYIIEYRIYCNIVPNINIYYQIIFYDIISGNSLHDYVKQNKLHIANCIYKQFYI